MTSLILTNNNNKNNGCSSSSNRSLIQGTQPPKPPPTIRRASSFSKLASRGSNGGFTDYVSQSHNDFVTVVQVEEEVGQKQADNKTHNDEFVTVLEIGTNDPNEITLSSLESTLIPDMEEITVFRLPGERLGMALKFEGGGTTTETIERVLIQNINADSPASKMVGKILGHLQEGDEIVEIDGKQVSKMTRLECVAALKDAPVCIKLLVKRTESLSLPQLDDNSKSEMLNSNGQAFGNGSVSKGLKKGPPPPIPPRMSSTSLTSLTCKTNGGIVDCVTSDQQDKYLCKRRPSQPPPLPPRRLKESLSLDSALEQESNSEQNAFYKEAEKGKSQTDVKNDLLSGHQVKSEPSKGKGSISVEKRTNEVETPPLVPVQAESYLDSLTECETTLIESESDDTGSSVSTVIERFSRGSTANSSFSDNLNGLKNGNLDIEKVLSPFEQLERELDEKEALQKFVSKTAAVLMDKQDGSNSMGYDVNLDDYDDIQSVSMHFDVNNYVDQIVEPPLSFSNSSGTSEQPSKVNDTSKINNTTQSPIEQRKTINGVSKKEDTPVLSENTLDFSKVNEAKEIQRNEAVHNGGIISTPMVDQALRNSHKTQMSVQLLSSTPTRLDKTGDSKSVSQKTESKEEITHFLSKTGNYWKNIQDFTPDLDFDMFIDKRSALLTKTEREFLESETLLMGICTEKSADVYNFGDARQRQLDQKALLSSTSGVTSFANKTTTCGDKDSLENKESDKRASGGSCIQNEPRPNVSNSGLPLEEQDNHLKEPELFLTDKYPLPAFKELDDDLLSPIMSKMTEESKSEAMLEEESRLWLLNISHKSYMNDFNDEDFSKSIIDERVTNTDNTVSSGNDDGFHSSIEEEHKASPIRRSSLTKVNGKCSSLIPKLEPKRAMPPPICPRKSKSTLNLSDFEPLQVRPSLIPRAILKPANKPLKPEPLMRRAKSIDNMKGLSFSWEKRRPSGEKKKEKCVKFSDIVDIETYKENMESEEESSNVEAEKNATGGGMKFESGSNSNNPTANVMPSSLDTKKQNASKLKGLVIPDLPTFHQPQQPSLSKALPTIVSNTSSSTDLFLSKPEEAETLTRKTSSESSKGNGFFSGSSTASGRKGSLGTTTTTVLSEPPWVSPKSVVPKYSPAFKRRVLELPRSSFVSNSNSINGLDYLQASKTVSKPSPSSVSAVATASSTTTTTPLSPNSCVTSSIANNKFSLSHSKPITPLLPETASMRPSSSQAREDERRITRDSDSCLDRQLTTTDSPDSALGSPVSSSEEEKSPTLGSHRHQETINKVSLMRSTMNGKKEDPHHHLNHHVVDNKKPFVEDDKERMMKPADEVSISNSHQNNHHMKTSELFVNINCEDESTSRAKKEVIGSKREVVPSPNSLEPDKDKEEGFKINENSSSSLLSPDNSDDESSSLLSQKTSDGLFNNKADDSAYDTLSDSFERNLSPDIRIRPKEFSLQRTVLKSSGSTSDVSSESKTSESVKHFKALAEKWEKRVSSSVDQSKNLSHHPSGCGSSSGGSGNKKSSLAPPLPPKPKDVTRIPPSFQPRASKGILGGILPQHDSTFDGVKDDKEEIKEQHPSNKPIPEPKKIDTSLWENNSNLKKEKTTESAGVGGEETVPSGKKNHETVNTNSVPSSNNKSFPTPTASTPAMPSTRSMSVSDIRRVFEILTTSKPATSISSVQTSKREEQEEQEEQEEMEDALVVAEESSSKMDVIPSSETSTEKVVDDSRVTVEEEEVVAAVIEEGQKEEPQIIPEIEKALEAEKNFETSHHRMSSLDSTNSDSGTQSGFFDYGSGVVSRTSSVSNLKDSQYGSITSLASTTSLISPQELQHLIDEANQSLEGELPGQSAHSIQVVVLHREYVTYGSIGITLAGGVDYETKEITVHKVINGSLADRDGRIRKGDRILSINGKILKGVTHREALNILKAPRPEVVIVLSRSTNSDGTTSNSYSRCNSVDSIDERRTDSLFLRSKSEDTLLSSNLSEIPSSYYSGDSYKIYKAVLIKDGAGLGFILEGGKDSPLGDKPLAIKRVFKGGPADKEGTLMSGDELLTVNDVSVRNMTRSEAWNHLKKLPDGEVVIVIRRKVYSCFT